MFIFSIYDVDVRIRCINCLLTIILLEGPHKDRNIETVLLIVNCVNCMHLQPIRDQGFRAQG